ncbi:MAG TPA: FAD-binding and (Fe-S)-binding domain-containing protein [Solirubrobacteraceae bacterium]|nr:FAD-binding and (Fe-S)-binding domain-containing protein [Solirubrobacteraceae bacterium]
MARTLTPDVRRIGRPPGGPTGDRAPDSVAAGTPEPLRSELTQLLGADRVLCRPIDLIRYASDASPYRRIPKVVVQPRDTREVAAVVAFCAESGTALNFRGGGTSLSGQAQCDGVLVDMRRHLRGVHVLEGGERLRVATGTRLGLANRILAPTGYQLGPDPASKDIATVGGVIANNSGGMRCGTDWDSYSTVESLTLVLADGTVIDTAAPHAEERFAAAAPDLARGLVELRAELLADEALATRVRAKFSIKNTTGYRLCALLDAESPLEIFRRLVVGSEGTLACVTEAVMRTRPEPACTTVAWAHFANIDAAAAPVAELVAAGARATELMVAPALIAASWNMAGTPESWRELPMDGASLIIEFGGADDAELAAAEARAAAVLERHTLLEAARFSRDRQEIEMTWRVREGLFGLVGVLRPPGSVLIVEDVCVAPEMVAACARDLQELLGRHGFLPGVAGHASAGNLHFQLTPGFGDPAEQARYEAFMEDLVELIVGRYDGSLKSEHGTGVNMAPYVEREWGAELTAMMWRIRELADPRGILNPGAVLSRDPEIHRRDLISLPEIEQPASICVECGFCEPVCPSRDLTLTPRQRIVVRREMARQPLGSPLLEALLDDFEYDGLQTCAADGACEAACPVAIDTGALVRELRGREHGRYEEGAAAAAARHFGLVERATRTALERRSLAGGAARALRERVSSERIPLPPDIPAARKLPATRRENAAALYLPACINRMFGGAADHEGPSLPQALVAVSARAGMPLWIPDGHDGVCCGMPWSSKGYAAGHERMVERTAAALAGWSENGELPVVTDASSCALGFTDALTERGITVLDSVAWVHDHLLPRLRIERRTPSAALHVTCATDRLGLREKLEALAAALAEEVFVPPAATCCGMAGDRGMLHPELPASALAPAAGELASRDFDAHLCSNRTCEIALQQATGDDYGSFVLLLERLTRASMPAP